MAPQLSSVFFQPIICETHLFIAKKRCIFRSCQGGQRGRAYFRYSDNISWPLCPFLVISVVERLRRLTYNESRVGTGFWGKKKKGGGGNLCFEWRWCQSQHWYIHLTLDSIFLYPPRSKMGIRSLWELTSDTWHLFHWGDKAFMASTGFYLHVLLHIY